MKTTSQTERFVPRVQKVFNKPSKTRASEVANTNLKALVDRFRLSGGFAPPMQYGDVSDLPTSRLEAMEVIQAASDAFYDLPLKVRQAVGHDPRNLDTFIAGNPELARQFGLLAQASTPTIPAEQSQPADAGGENLQDAE